jgi:HEAT repeat protein
MAGRSNEVLIRKAAAEALGRLALPKTIPGLVALLDDPSKLVQRAAAWSLRQVYAAHPEAKDDQLLAALGAKDWRMRWGATRVFAHHFATLAGRGELVTALEKLVSDPAATVNRPFAAGRVGSGTPIPRFAASRTRCSRPGKTASVGRT